MRPLEPARHGSEDQTTGRVEAASRPPRSFAARWAPSSARPVSDPQALNMVPASKPSNAGCTAISGSRPGTSTCDQPPSHVLMLIGRVRCRRGRTTSTAAGRSSAGSSSTRRPSSERCPARIRRPRRTRRPRGRSRRRPRHPTSRDLVELRGRARRRGQNPAVIAIAAPISRSRATRCTDAPPFKTELLPPRRLTLPSRDPQGRPAAAPTTVRGTAPRPAGAAHARRHS